jgi:hypothetical protein
MYYFKQPHVAAIILAMWKKSYRYVYRDVM